MNYLHVLFISLTFSARICLGTTPHRCDISPYRDVDNNEQIFIGDLSLNAGDTIFATAIVYNNVGLWTMLSSDGAVMSPDPHLIILDGNVNEDIDFQTDLNVIQGIPF